MHSTFQLTKAFKSLGIPNFYVQYSFFLKREKRNLPVKNCEESMIFTLLATWQISVNFRDAVRRHEIPESETKIFITHSTTRNMSFIFLSVSLVHQLPQKQHRAAQADATHTVVCVTADGPNLRKLKYIIIGCKQTYLNFAPGGDIIYIILDSKKTCHLSWKETQSLSFKAIKIFLPNITTHKTCEGPI